MSIEPTCHYCGASDKNRCRSQDQARLCRAFNTPVVSTPDLWIDHPIIGYVVVNDDDGKPYQPTIGSGYQARKKPVTVYKTLEVALRYGNKAREVRMFGG